jgi:hypothetical protein
MNHDPDDYWFPRKRYGWGWGPPRKWQGWVVLVGYIGSIYLATALVPPDTHFVGFLAMIGLLSGALIFVCWKKGEPPRWQWGEDERLP